MKSRVLLSLFVSTTTTSTLLFSTSPVDAFVPPSSSFGRPISSARMSESATTSPTTTDASSDGGDDKQAKQTTTSPAPPSSSASPSNLKGDFYKCYEQTKLLLTKTLGGNPYGDAMMPILHHFANEYMYAAQQGYDQDPTNKACGAQETMERFLQGIELGVTYGMGDDKYTFGSSHKALRGKNPDAENGNTYDYYKFGCDFFQPCMNLDQSVVRGQEYLQEAVDKMKKGENVVFLANHQSEADPQVFSVLLESLGFAKQAEDVTYVAGHKVTTDPLAIPFSMGRNLICIHSKKHIDSDPETKPRKQKQNLAAMGSMLGLLKKGGAALWVAPSGGRDRRDPESNTVPIAHFDSKTIDMFRLMGNKSKTPTHYYPLAMVSYDLCPPPDYTESAVGEERNVRFVPVGIACGPEVSSVGGLESRHDFCRKAQEICEEEYEKLLEEIQAKKE